MEVTLTQEEAQAMLQIISRTTFNGQEAESIVMLKQKIVSQLQKEVKEEPKKESK